MIAMVTDLFGVVQVEVGGIFASTVSWLIASVAISDETGSYPNGFDLVLALLPYVVLLGCILGLVLILAFRVSYLKKNKKEYIHTLSPRHFTPHIFKILGKHCHQLAYRTGESFVLLSLKINNVKVSKNMHAEFGFCLGNCIRDDDIIGDYGLGEFKVVLPYIADVSDFHIVLHRFRSELIKTSILSQNVERSVTIFPDDGSSFDEMLTASDHSHEPL